MAPSSARSAAAPPEALPPDEIAAALTAYLAGQPDAVLLEEGRVLFDLRSAQHAVSAAHGRCTLQLWNEEGNVVRRVLSLQPRPGGVLRCVTLRFGHREPQTLEFAPSRERRPRNTGDAARARYLRLLQRVLPAQFPGERVEGLTTAMDLQRSFGPAYARGVMVRGSEAWAVIGVNASETASTIDGLLTLGLLWLGHCREHAGGRRIFAGLRLICPAGASTVTRSRLAWLNPAIAQYHLLELDEHSDEMVVVDPGDHGNTATRLLHAADAAAAVAPGGRFAEAIPRVLRLLPAGAAVPAPWGSASDAPELRQIPGCLVKAKAAHRRNRGPGREPPTIEMRLRSSAELVFLLHGLEFARVRAGYGGGSFNRQLEVTAGSGAHETPLTDGNEPHLRQLVHELFRRRVAEGDTRDPVFRAAPEAWLGSRLRQDLGALDPTLGRGPVYTEVPAFAGAGRGAERGMMDLLTVTRDQQLAVLEIKASEDLHMAMQGLDYWICVRKHHLAHTDPATGLGELQQQGYFPATRLRAEPPHLFLVAPALEVHPATETLLRYLAPEVQWTLVAIDQRWRSGIRVVWRCESGRPV